jgi:predicted XRE-type DNA-binding protein
MTEADDFELIRGSGNVYADLGMADAEMRQLRAMLAAEVIKALDAEGLSVRAAQRRTGIAAADFSRIRNVKLAGFTADRLMTILHRLNRDVQVSVSVLPIGTMPDSGLQLQM